MEQNTRPQYYDGEYLSSDDLEAIVRYARVAQARHALGAHVWGLAIGLELVERALSGDDVEMVLTPGVAWDGYARALVAQAPQRIGLDLFENFQEDTAPEGIPVEVWLAYRELPASPPGVGFSCTDDALYGRIVETFRVELRRTPITDYHAVSIASRSIEAVNALKAFDASKGPLYDESVPEQAFPERGDNLRWPVFVGIVRWKKDTGQPGKVMKRTDADRNQARKNRQYLGTVAEAIVAPDGVLRLRDRASDPKDPVINYQPPIVAAPAGTTVVNDLVWCEGHLRVVGDTRLQNGKLDYRVEKGGDDGVPMYLRRTFANAKTTLNAFVGPPAAPAPPNAQTRFTVSSTDLTTGNAKECLTVVTDGRVGIDQPDPQAVLHVHSDDPAQGNIRLFSPTADFEYDGGSDQVFVFKDTGGKTAFIGGDVGIGTTAPTAKVHVHSTNPLQGDIQLFSPTADFEYDGGSDQVFVFKDTGGKTAFMGGDVGIGTSAPGAKLHVHSKDPLQGDIRLFSGAADFEYDGGSDRVFVFKDTGGKTAFMGGDVGIGTSAPAAKVHVHSDNPLQGDIQLFSANADVEYDGGTDRVFVIKDTGGKTAFIGGNIGIGTTNPGVALDVVGDLSVSGNAFLNGFFISDAREKKRIEPIHRALEQLLALRGVSFAWREAAKHGASTARHLGFVAQDVEAVFPSWVKETPSGTKAVNVAGLNALLVEGVRELTTRCEKLEADVAELRERLAKYDDASAPAPRKPARPRASRKKAPADEDRR